MIHFITFTLENIFIKWYKNLNFLSLNGSKLIQKTVNFLFIIMKLNSKKEGVNLEALHQNRKNLQINVQKKEYPCL